MFDRTTIRNLGASQVLDALVAQRAAAERCEANILALAVHYVDLHPDTDLEGAAARVSQTARLDATGGVATAVAGPDTPSIAEYAVEELAATLDLGYQTALQLVCDAVELCFRLPRLWALVQAGTMRAWQARQVAARTPWLSAAAVDFVDRHVAAVGGRTRLGDLRALIHEAMLRCDPDQAAAVEQAALEHRGVWMDHRESTATTHVTAKLDTLDALDLDATISDLATTIGRLGDRRHLDLRRATALGMLAHPQRTLDLVHGHPGEPTPATKGLSACSGTGHGSGSQVSGRRRPRPARAQCSTCTSTWRTSLAVPVEDVWNDWGQPAWDCCATGCSVSTG